MNILMIAPYEGLKDIIYEIKREQDLNIDIRIGELYEALHIVFSENLEYKYDVIISRGATANLLRKFCEKPVIEIKITSYDILRTLGLLKGYSGKIGVMSYQNVIYGADIIGNLLNMDLSFYPVNEEENIQEGLEKARKDGIQLIIGDVLLSKKANNYGLHGILITSGKESIQDAIKDAIQLYNYRTNKNHSKAKEIPTIVYFPMDKISHSRFSLNQIIGKNQEMLRIKEAAHKLSKSDLPIYIHGEVGAGKKTLAKAIHFESKRKNKPFLLIDCKFYSPEKLSSELFGVKGRNVGAFEKVGGGTLCIRSITSLPFALQSPLLEYLKSFRDHFISDDRPRIITISDENIETTIASGVFRKDLFEALNVFSLKIPPLRQRKEDIDDLVRLFIAKCNEKMGKQIVGIDESIKDLLIDLNWPENVNQLKNTIEQMCFISPGPFISEKSVKPIITQLIEGDRFYNDSLFSIAGKTLEEIEFEAIQKILKQENYNQSKTAKRLGIDRSTLWRKIKWINKRQ